MFYILKKIIIIGVAIIVGLIFEISKNILIIDIECKTLENSTGEFFIKLYFLISGGILLSLYKWSDN